MSNMAIYRNMTALAKAAGAQMIVFPEFGLGGELGSFNSAAQFTENVPNVVAGNLVTIPFVVICFISADFTMK